MAQVRRKVLKDRALAKELSDVLARVKKAPKEYKMVEMKAKAKKSNNKAETSKSSGASPRSAAKGVSTNTPAPKK